MALPDRGSHDPLETDLARATPEAQVQAAHDLLARHVDGEAIVDVGWRTIPGLCRAARSAFLRLEIAVRPTAFVGVESTPWLVEGLLQLRARDVRPDDLATFVDLCLAAEQEVLQRHLLVVLDAHCKLADPQALLVHYERLLDTVVASIATDRIRAFGGRVPAYAALQGGHRSLAAVEAHASSGDRVLLLRLASDASSADAIRLAALAGLAAAGTRDDLQAVLAIGCQRPEAFASAAVTALIGLRHRGIFVQAEQLPQLFQLAVHTPTPLASLTTHLIDERLELLLGVPIDDPRLSIWLLAFETTGMGLGPWYVQLLDSPSYGVRAAVLERLARAPILDLTTRAAAELAVWEQVDRHPEASRQALSVVGGRLTCDRLMDGLSADGLDAPWMPVLIGLLPDGDPRLDELEGTLSAVSSWTERLWHVPRGTGRTRVRLAPGMEPARLFERLCSAGSLSVVPDLLHILRNHTHALGEPADPWSPAPSRRPDLAASIVTALEGMAAAVDRRGGLEPLLGVLPASERPSAFVSWVLVRALDALDDPTCRRLLVRSVPLDGLPAETLIDWSRVDDPELRRDVLERMGEHDDVVSVGAYVVRAMADEDARVARAATRAAVSLQISLAVPALIGLLERPRMELKRVAARGLAELGDGRAVAPLVGWLGRHDNQGFRRELLAALQALLPTGARGLLVAAHERATGRTARLLLEAVAALDEPHAVERSAPDRADEAPRRPFLLRAEAFAASPSTEALDALLTPSIGSLSVDAERDLLCLVDPLFQTLSGPVPVDRAERERRGLAARNLVVWTTDREVPDHQREQRIARLRALPTLPMGAARWEGLRAVDAVATLADLTAALSDCGFTASREASMRTVLEGTGLADDVVDALVSASDADRERRLVECFAKRSVLPAPSPHVVFPGPVDRRVLEEEVRGALEGGGSIPEDWPWAPACHDAVVRVGGRRRPTAHASFLRGLFVDALPDLPPTPERVAWTARWTDCPEEVDRWADRPVYPAPARIRQQPRRVDRPLVELLPDATVDTQRAPATREDGLKALGGDPLRGLRMLAGFPGAEVAAAVRPLLDERELRAAALRCYRRVASRADVCDALRSMLADREDEWVRSCARVLGFMRDPASVRTFVGLLEHRSRGVRRAAREALLLQPEAAESALRRAVRRARPDRRAALAEVLASLE